MSGVARRPLPDVPFLSAFPELNLRVYVSCAGKPGVWFLSLDATNPSAVWAARRFFHLPYHLARIRITRRADAFHYDSERRGRPAPIRFRARFAPEAAPFRALPGTIEHFLMERYCLYSRSPTGRILRTNVHHAPWSLCAASAEIEENALFAAQGLAITGPPRLTHFAELADVVIWPPERVEISSQKPGDLDRRA
jgi:uncharacterized protein YqjF (DUF2071 family)